MPTKYFGVSFLDMLRLNNDCANSRGDKTYKIQTIMNSHIRYGIEKINLTCFLFDGCRNGHRLRTHTRCPSSSLFSFHSSLHPILCPYYNFRSLSVPICIPSASLFSFRRRVGDKLLVIILIDK